MTKWISVKELEKYAEVSVYNGGHDALNGLNKRGRIRYFKAKFTPPQLNEE